MTHAVRLNIGVLAAGAWGTALAANWAQRHHVCIWAREPEVVASINKDHINHQFLPKISLPVNLRATGDLADLCASDVLVLATPVAALRVTVQALKSLYGSRPLPPLVWVCKGFEPQTGLLPHQGPHGPPHQGPHGPPHQRPHGSPHQGPDDRPHQQPAFTRHAQGADMPPVRDRARRSATPHRMPHAHVAESLATSSCGQPSHARAT